MGLLVIGEAKSGSTISIRLRPHVTGIYSNPTATRVETVVSVDKKTPLIPHVRDSMDSGGPHIRYGSAILVLLMTLFLPNGIIGACMGCRWDS